jgi:hypothetical protein
MPAVREIRVQLDILDMDGETLSSIDHRVLDGQVNVATDADGPTRSMSVSLYDPERRLRLDSDAPTAGSLFADRMLRAWYGVNVPGVGWVDVPVFTGPIMRVSRDDVTLNVECQGKESLALNPVWRSYTVEKGVAKVEAIRRILRERAGETDFDLPDLAVKLGAPVVLAPEPPGPRTVGEGEKKREVPFGGMSTDTPWGLARKIAQSMSRQLFYDGLGRCRLREIPGSPLFTFDETLIGPAVGQGGPPPQIAFDMTEMRNAVRVTGKTLGEGKERNKEGDPAKNQLPRHVVKGEAVAPEGHPLAPGRLGRTLRDGSRVGRVIPEFVTNDAIRSDQEATRRARQILDDRLAQQVDVSFDALPVPHLEELDMIRVSYGDLRMQARLRRFALPLTHGGVMSVGYVKRVSRPRRSR